MKTGLLDMMTPHNDLREKKEFSSFTITPYSMINPLNMTRVLLLNIF